MCKLVKLVFMHPYQNAAAWWTRLDKQLGLYYVLKLMFSHTLSQTNGIVSVLFHIHMTETGGKCCDNISFLMFYRGFLDMHMVMVLKAQYFEYLYIYVPKILVTFLYKSRAIINNKVDSFFLSIFFVCMRYCFYVFFVSYVWWIIWANEANFITVI